MMAVQNSTSNSSYKIMLLTENLLPTNYAPREGKIKFIRNKLTNWLI